MDHGPGFEEPTSHFAVRIEPGCIKGLKWRGDVPCDRSSIELMLRYLRSLGFHETSPDFAQGRFLSFASPAGHDVLLVPATGRIQIRLDRLTPESDRALVAKEVAVVLAKAFRGALEPSSLES